LSSNSSRVLPRSHSRVGGLACGSQPRASTCREAPLGTGFNEPDDGGGVCPDRAPSPRTGGGGGNSMRGELHAYQHARPRRKSARTNQLTPAVSPPVSLVAGDAPSQCGGQSQDF
jgi:hypothetical protein